jgi:hypothetical protein
VSDVKEESVVTRQVQASVPERETVVLPDAAPHSNHGRTLAGWTLTWGVVLGCAVVAVGMVVPSMPMIWIGSGVVVVALALGAILRALGHGQPRVTRHGDVVD